MTLLAVHPNISPGNLRPGPRAFPLRRKPDVSDVLAALGVHGSSLRASLAEALLRNLLIRRGRDPIAVVGCSGSGKHLLVHAIHRTALEILGRGGELVRVFCGLRETRNHLDTALLEASGRARGGTLVLEDFDRLSTDEQRVALRIGTFPEQDAILVTVATVGATLPGRLRRIDLPPLHARGRDVRELVEHFAEEVSHDCGHPGELSLDAVDTLAAHAVAHRLASVGELRDLVTDVVVSAHLSSNASLALRPEAIVAVLAADSPAEHASSAYGDTTNPPLHFDPDGDAPFDEALLSELAELHDLPEELLRAQADVIARVADSLVDAPRSFRNVMDRTDLVRRLGIWLLSGAGNQADFRRSFGDKRFMQPGKSSAWAFFNVVFKRDG